MTLVRRRGGHRNVFFIWRNKTGVSPMSKDKKNWTSLFSSKLEVDGVKNGLKDNGEGKQPPGIILKESLLISL